ncbi:hypothetical protein SKAU_G00189830 [Synaphobranchus kaupii]|uniref:G-protein coupled receptors family 3 profile domain-containing protein n=1 Tax=Synaphobranchus kaupii TaxID=118154 RepID=A0A9Q1FDE6_SYNKA|nr:hypothetical protein SKAU_G00189830 [Synaphobranchus kaupii]
MLSRLFQCIIGVSLLLSLGGCCDLSLSTCGAEAPGDVLIGVLNPYHVKVAALHKRTRPERFNCTDFHLEGFVQTLAVIYTIETINDSGFLPGVRLGYSACDTCSDANKAIHIAERLLSINGSLPVLCDYTDYLPPVKVIIGDRYSELSITVARLLGFYMVPQISCTSSAPILSDKLRFPAFLRTIPSDEHQTLALALLMSRFSWDWIGVVSGDDDYGTAALQRFLLHARDAGVCIAFQEVMPHYLDKSNSRRRIQEVAKQIRSSQAKVVLLILKEQLVEELLQEMIRTNTSRTWIASDAWSFSRHIASMEGINKVGDIFGFTFITGDNPGFKQYLQKLNPGPGAVNHFIQEYKQLRFSCTPELLQHRDCLNKQPAELCPVPDSLRFKSPKACSLPAPDPQHTDDDFLVHSVSLTETYNARLAVLTIAHALKHLLKCNETACTGEKNFPPWKLLEELKKVNFELDNRQLYYDESGNFMTGYELIMWVKAGDRRQLRVVGRYRQMERDVELNEDKLQWINPGNNTVPQSRCSQPCAPGTVKRVSNISCCYNCTQCEEGTYTDDWNQNNCQKCPNGTWSLRGWSHCEERTEMFYKWEEPYAIALVTAAGLGILLLLAILIIFLVHRKTPAVKIAGPRQAMYALGFTLCVSCILVRAFRTFLAFLFDLDKQHKLKKLYKPLAIVILVNTGQGLICTFWLIFDSPQDQALWNKKPVQKLVQTLQISAVPNAQRQISPIPQNRTSKAPT